MAKALQTEFRENFQLIKLNRPEKRNAINDDMILGIEEMLSNIPDHIKCAIIYGEGKHFCAGLDLSALKDLNVEEGFHHSRMWHRIMDRVQFSPVPVIAVLHGACVGGGLELASACHIRVAEKSTFYSLPEGQRGILVGGGSSVRLPKLIGISRMTDMILTGRTFNSEEGEHVGFSQYLVDDGKGLNKAMELAGKIASNSAMTNYAVTHILPRIADASTEQGLLIESLTAAIAQGSPEAKKRLSDFLKHKTSS
jgi:enoyl-CoA hydratase/carnithine racemase